MIISLLLLVSGFAPFLEDFLLWCYIFRVSDSLINPKCDHILPLHVNYSNKSSLLWSYFRPRLALESIQLDYESTLGMWPRHWAWLDRKCRRDLVNIFWNLYKSKSTYLQFLTIEHRIFILSVAKIDLFFSTSRAEEL